VRSVRKSVELYEPLFGPFVVIDNGPFDAVYRGRPEKADLIVAFGRSGPLEIELIEWRSGATPHRDFIAAGLEGLHHLRFPVETLAPWVERAQAAGYEPVWSGEYARYDIRWSYLCRANDPVTIEFVSKCHLSAASTLTHQS
jgi:hypothetical protein